MAFTKDAYSYHVPTQNLLIGPSILFSKVFFFLICLFLNRLMCRLIKISCFCRPLLYSHLWIHSSRAVLPPSACDECCNDALAATSHPYYTLPMRPIRERERERERDGERERERGRKTDRDTDRPRIAW